MSSTAESPPPTDEAPAAPVTPEAVRSLAARLITDELVILPVRHHSPACAWQVARAMEDLSPSAVLVEGPPAFDHLLPLLADDATRAPVAVFTYAVLAAPTASEPPASEPPESERTETGPVDSRPAASGPAASGPAASGPAGRELRTAAYYPFCDYSPELVAIREGIARGLPVRFIDLDHPEQAAASAPLPQAGPDEPTSLLDERRYDHSAYLQALAGRLGCRDGEELWEHLVETTAAGRDLPEHVAVLTGYCLLARAGSTPAELAADGTAAREAEMAWHIGQALQARADDEGPVLVVVGGFHAVALPDLLAAPLPRPPRRARVQEQASSLIRYSFDRLDRLNGYASGMTSPAWHQLVWDGMGRSHRAGLAPSGRPRDEAALHMLLTIAQRLRREQRLDLPVPAVQAAYEAALRLAALRGRQGPARDDVLDAVTSAFVKSDVDGPGGLVLAVARDTLAGQDLGRVPPGAGTPPLVRDVLTRCRRQRLKVDDTARHSVVLDIHRKTTHRTTSRLLHGLELLAVPLGTRTAGPDFVTGWGMERLLEHWDYGWSAAVEAALVEASVHGATLPAAVSHRFGQLLDARLDHGEVHDARIAAQLLTQACILGLHDRLADAAHQLAAAVAAERDFAAAAAAATTLALLQQAREPLEAWRIPDLPGLLHATYTRALLLGRDLPELDTTDEQALLAAATGLVRLRELLVGAAAPTALDDEGSALHLDDGSGASLDPDPYWLLIDELSTGHTAPLIAGAASGLAYSAGRLTGRQLAGRVAGRLTGTISAPIGVLFLRGVLHTAREAAWQEDQILDVLDRLLREAEEERFLQTLPDLRLAFADLTPRETDRVAAQVSAMHAGARLVTDVRYDLDDADLAANLALSREVVTALDADGLTTWMTS